MNNTAQAMTAAADITRKSWIIWQRYLHYLNEKKQPSFQSSSTNLSSVMGTLKNSRVGGIAKQRGKYMLLLR
jgi:hypothetical protein